MDSEEGPHPKSYSFASGGWLQFYLFGVAKYMKEHGCHNNSILIGCSAGALAAAGLACNGDFDNAVEFSMRECIPRYYGHIFGIFKLNEFTNDCLDHACNLKDYNKIPSGGLQIAVTALPSLKRSIVSSFSSAEDLKECLLASSAALPFAPPVLRDGKWMVDGSFIEVQPTINADTVTISPFYFSNTDIKPSRYVPLWWALFPPRCDKTIDWMYR